MSHSDRQRSRSESPPPPGRARRPDSTQGPGRPIPSSAEGLTPTAMLALQRAAGNRNANLAVQRADGPTGAVEAGPSQAGAHEAGTPARDDESDRSSNLGARSARRSLARSIVEAAGRTKIDTGTVRRALLRQTTVGPPLTAENIQQVRQIAQLNRQWLNDIGMGTYEEADAYLSTGKFYNWLKLKPGKRVLIASLAWDRRHTTTGATPTNPAYTLGRTMALHGGAVTGEEKSRYEQERDQQIRTTFLNTLDRDSFPDEEQVTPEHRAKNDRALDILTRVMLILQNGLKIYKLKDADGRDVRDHVDYREGDVARALAHGGRVNIRIPATGAGGPGKSALTDWLGLTKDGKDAVPGERRPGGTHRMSIGRRGKSGEPGRFEETGGTAAGAMNFAGRLLGENRPMYGQNPAVGGLGNRNFNGQVILPNGSFGHMLLAFTPPKENRDGALQVGIETIAPKTASPVGYVHNAFSKEKTANPESSFHGHKVDKIGEGKLNKNQRLVNLREFTTTGGGGWDQYLKDVQQKWDALLAAAQSAQERRELYQRLIGPRTDYFRPDSAED